MTPPPRILIAEDDLDDQLLLRDALEQNGLANIKPVFVEDGEQLLQLLNKPSSQPTIILLDLNMPGKDGRQVLKEIKSNETLRHIPVIVLSTSTSEQDINLTYKYGTNTFFTKPAHFADLVKMVKLIGDYWLQYASVANLNQHRNSDSGME